MSDGKRLFRPVQFCGASLLALTSFLVEPTAALAQSAPSIDEMWRMLQEQQQLIEEQNRAIARLNGELRASRSGAVDTAATAVSTPDGMVSSTPDGMVSSTPDVFNGQDSEGLGGAGWWQRTSLGAYGELHYNGGETDEIDLHRFVILLSHQFSERVRMFGELEIEHALVKDTGDGSGPGEVEVEQAYVEVDLLQGGCASISPVADYAGPLEGSLVGDVLEADCVDYGRHTLRAGLMLLPVGILNEVHEPPTFYGVERNGVETNIIPTTWWEGGVGMQGFLGQTGFSYDAMLHSGLRAPTTGGNAFKIRNGRQKVAKAVAEQPAVTGRLRYTGIPGVELGVSGQHQFDITQEAIGDEVEATLFEAHIDAEREIADGIALGFRGLYAHWWLSGGEPGFDPDENGRDEQYGWYVEPSIKFLINEELGAIGFFTRFAQWDNEAGDSSGSVLRQYQVGLNYWPLPDVVFKFDYQFDDNDVANEDERVNFGLGFQF